MELEATRIISRLRDALEEEWRKNHAAFCKEEFPHEGECLYPRIIELLEWDGDLPKCEYCGRNVIKTKSWQKYCSRRCTAAAWREREKDKKEKESVTL